MQNHITLELSPSQVESLVERLPLEDKIRLVRRLEKETWAKRLGVVVEKMRKHVKEKGITDKEIDRICEEVRKERYAKNQSRH
jgi:Mg/Co/Ni transporter MgtE